MTRKQHIALGVVAGVLILCALCSCLGLIGSMTDSDSDETPTPTPTKTQSIQPLVVVPTSAAPSPTPSDVPVVVVPTTQAAPPPPEPTEAEEEMQTGISPGAYCSPEGAKGRGKNGGIYTCKSSSTDSRNRWRK